jgi:hypothetical protein
MDTETNNTTEIVKLVLGVARMGENDLFGWWGGHAIDRTGQYVLSSMFRRTWRPAALQLDVSAAARIHDELLGRSTAVHLFSDSVPFRRWTTGWLAEQKTAPDVPDLLEILEKWTADEAIDALRRWCGGLEPPEGRALGNGLLLGRLSSADLDDPAPLLETARVLAASYLNQTDPMRPPYFDLTR